MLQVYLLYILLGPDIWIKMLPANMCSCSFHVPLPGGNLVSLGTTVTPASVQGLLWGSSMLITIIHTNKLGAYYFWDLYASNFYTQKRLTISKVYSCFCLNQ